MVLVELIFAEVVVVALLSGLLLARAPEPSRSMGSGPGMRGSLELKRGEVASGVAKIGTELVLTAVSEYVERCLGSDYVSVSGQCFNRSGIGLMAVDSIDSVWIAGDFELYRRLRRFVESSFTCGAERVISFHDLNVHVIGGLVSAYLLTGDGLFLEKAIECGNVATRAFGGATVPKPLVGGRRVYDWVSGATLNDAASFLLEFEGLARVSGEEGYRKYGEPFVACVKRLFEGNMELPLMISEGCEVVNGRTGMSSLNVGGLANILRYSLVHSAGVVDDIVQGVSNLFWTKTPKYMMKSTNSSVSRLDSSACTLVPLLRLVGHKKSLVDRLQQRCGELVKDDVPRASGILHKNYLDVDDNSFSYDAWMIEDRLIRGESLRGLEKLLDKVVCNETLCQTDVIPLNSINRWAKLLMLDGVELNYLTSFVINEAGHFIPAY